MRKNKLPSLILGEKTTDLKDDIAAFSSKVAQVVPSLEYFDNINKSKVFYGKTKVIKLDNITIAATSCTPISLKSTDFAEISLMVPFAGSCTTTMDNKKYTWNANENAILMPNIGRESISNDNRSGLVIDLKPDALYKIANDMLDDEYVDLRLNEPRLVPLTYGDFSFDIAIRRLCTLIDAYDGTNGLLDKLGIGELFYRNIVMMLAPKKFFGAPSKNRQTRYDSAVNLLIGYAKSNPEYFYNIYDMEKFTRLSVRSLQYAFKQVLNTTPALWLRGHKLEIARDKIVNNSEHLSISDIALSLGFSNFSLFAKYYKEKFGELPSQTKCRCCH